MEVKLATHNDLFQILPFLESHLPYYCDVHSVVLANLLTFNCQASSYQVYFLMTELGEFSAIVGAKKETAPTETNHESRPAWRLNSWVVDEPSLLKVLDAMAGANIEWERDLIFAFHHENYLTVDDYLDQKKSVPEQKEFLFADRYVLDVNDALAFDLKEIPVEVYVKSLERHHAQFVYDNWFPILKKTSSAEDIAIEIDQMPSAGVFLKETDELVTWMMWHPFMGISRVITRENHRRLGYASLAIRYLSKRIAQCGYVPNTSIRSYNTPSILLFQSLGFRAVRQYKSVLLT